MISTGIDIIDCIITNPLQAMVLGVSAYMCYWIYGLYKQGDFNPQYIPSDVWSYLTRLVNNKDNSMCGLVVENIDETMRIILATPGMHNWEQRDMISKQTGMSGDETNQIIRSFVNAKLLTWDDQYSLVAVKKELKHE